MSSEFKSILYIESESCENSLRKVIEYLQRQGWYYDSEYDGYTINREFEWSFDDTPDVKDGIQQISTLGVGAITLSGGFDDELLNTTVSIDHSMYEGANENQYSSLLRIVLSTGRGPVLRSQSILDTLTETIIEIIETNTTLLAYAGSEYEIPANPTASELDTQPSELAPLTYFGQAMCDHIGRERIASVPLGETRSIGDGILLLACSNYAAGCYQDVYAAIADHLEILFV